MTHRFVCLFNLFNNIYCVGFTVCNPDFRCCGCNLDETVFHKIIPHKIITAETKRSYGYYTSNFPIIQASEHCSCYPSESFSVKKILTFKRRFKLCDVATHISHNQPEPHHHKRYVIKQCLFKAGKNQICEKKSKQTGINIVTICFFCKNRCCAECFANRKPKIPKRTKPITPVETRIVRKPLCKSLL